MGDIKSYRDRCTEICRAKGTTERSYYPAIEALIEGRIGSEAIVFSELALHRKNAPDLGIYESGVPLVFVEVKNPGTPVNKLLRIEQAKRYARVAAGYVIVTNLNDYVLAELLGDRLEARIVVTLFDDDIDGEHDPR